MVHRSKWLPWLACAVVAAVGFPGLAQGESADPPAQAGFAIDDSGFWDASQADHADTTVEIAAGGKVTWGYAAGAGNLPHNVKFDDPQIVSSCTSAPSIPVPSQTIPAVALAAPWTAECPFPNAGTFTFHCDVHPQMKGSVTVTGTSTPTPTATATPTPTATASPEPTPVAAASVVARDTDAPAARNWFENADVTVKPGEYVHFSSLDAARSHNVDFKDATQPVCKQTAGPPAGDSPPLPKYALPKGWAGDCRFDSPGVYAFVCDVHPAEMKGTVTVAVTALPAVVRDDNPAPSPKPWASLDKPAAKNAKVAVLLQGKLKLTARCAAVDKGTLTLSVSKAVAKKLKLKGTTLARGSSRCNGNGRFTATLKPTAAAKRALKRYHKAVRATLKLRLGAVTTSRAITLAEAR